MEDHLQVTLDCTCTCAVNMAATLDARFEVCGVVKPGSCTESLSEIMKKEVAKPNNKLLLIN